MKYLHNIQTLLLLLVLGAGALLASCDDDDDVTKADALFRPIVGETSVGGQWIELSWDRYQGADYYDLVLSGKDGLELTAETDTTFYRFENLNYDTDYVIKVRSHSKSTGLESKYYVVPTITTNDFPTKLKGVESIDNMALVSWGEDTYTNLKLFHVVTPEGGIGKEEVLVKDSLLTEADQKARRVIFEGLESKNDYVVRAYNHADYMGKKVFSTTAPESYEGFVIDLRSYSAEESYTMFTQAFIDELVAEHPDEDITIVLKGGTTYELQTIDLPSTTGTIKVVTGLTLEGMAKFAVSGNLGVKSGNSVNEFIAEKVFFTEHPNKPKTAGNFGGCYLFNFNRSDAKMGTLSIINSVIKYKRGVCRIQTTASIDNFVMDNCIVDSIGGYGVTNADNNGADIRNIKISNSSFSHCEKLFVSTKPSSKSVDSFSATNCTFVYNMKNGNNYMFDFNGMSFGSDPQLKNCIFGPGGNAVTIKDGAVSGKIGAFSAFRAAKGSMAVDNCYGTNDIQWYMAEGAEGPASALDLASTGGDVNKTFLKAAGSDFTLQVSDLKNVAGDPRWW